MARATRAKSAAASDSTGTTRRRTRANSEVSDVSASIPEGSGSVRRRTRANSHASDASGLSHNSQVSKSASKRSSPKNTTHASRGTTQSATVASGKRKKTTRLGKLLENTVKDFAADNSAEEEEEEKEKGQVDREESSDSSSSSDDDGRNNDEMHFFGDVEIKKGAFSLKKAAGISLQPKSTLYASKWSKTVQENDKPKKAVLSTMLDAGFRGQGRDHVAQLERNVVAEMTAGKYVSSITKDQRQSALRNAGERRDFHDMKTPELTESVMNDLKVLQMRNYLDPKRHYKASDTRGGRKALPKQFQIGTVQEGVGEFFTHRLTNKERKKTLVDQVLADRSARKYTKRVFGEIQHTKQNTIKLKRKKKHSRKKRNKT